MTERIDTAILARRTHPLAPDDLVKIEAINTREHVAVFAMMMARKHGHASHLDYLGAILAEAIAAKIAEEQWSERDAPQYLYFPDCTLDLDDDEVPF